MKNFKLCHFFHALNGVVLVFLTWLVLFPVIPKEIRSLAEKNKIRIASQNIRKYLQRPVEKKLIRKTERGFYTVPDRMFQVYIRSHSTLK